MKKVILCLIVAFAVCIGKQSKGQRYTRFALNASAANNQMWSSISGGTGLTGTLSLGFTPIDIFTVEGELESGQVNGRVRVYNENLPVSVSGFTTSYTYKGASLSLNLQKLFLPHRRNVKLIPFLYAGAGFLDFEARRYSEAGSLQKTYRYNTYTTRAGVKIKLKLNNYIDLLSAVETTMPQSFYVDASPIPKGYDRFTSFRLGLSYKIGGSEKRQHIDWSPRTRRGCNAWFGGGSRGGCGYSY